MNPAVNGWANGKIVPLIFYGIYLEQTITAGLVEKAQILLSLIRIKIVWKHLPTV